MRGQQNRTGMVSAVTAVANRKGGVMARKPSKSQIAFDALCAISFLCLEENPTLDDARRIAQEAIRALGKDVVRYTLVKERGQIITTCASGDYQKEQELGKRYMEAIVGVINADHPDEPEMKWTSGLIEDHPRKQV